MANHEEPTGETEIHRESTTGEAAVHDETVTRGTDDGAPVSWLSRVSWGAIFAGALVALVVMGLINLLGIAVGAVVLGEGAAGEGFGIGAGIWWTVSALIGLFIGGWTAGHFSTADIRSDGLMHGIVTWALFVLVTFLAVTTTVGQVLGGVFGMIGQNLTAALMAIQPQETLEATLLAQGVEPEMIAQMEETMAVAGDQAAEAMAIGAGWAFVALLLGVLVSALGGSFGVVEPGEKDRKRSERFASRLRPKKA